MDPKSQQVEKIAPNNIPQRIRIAKRRFYGNEIDDRRTDSFLMASRHICATLEWPHAAVAAIDYGKDELYYKYIIFAHVSYVYIVSIVSSKHFQFILAHQSRINNSHTHLPKIGIDRMVPDHIGIEVRQIIR